MSARSAWIVAAAGLAAQLAMLAGPWPVPDGVRTVLAFTLLVLWPGAALLELLDQRPPGGALLSAGWALALGVTWNAAWLAATALARVPFTTLSGVTAFASAALWCAVAWRSARSIAKPREPDDALRGIAPWLIAAAAALAALHCARLGARLTFISDAPDHIGTLRRMLAHGVLFPDDSCYRDIGAAGADPRKSLWHGIVALTCALAHADPVETWRAMPALLAPLFVLNVAALGTLVGGGSGAAVAAVVLVLTYGGTLADSALRDGTNSAKLADQLSIAACAAALADLTRPGRGSRRAAALIAAGAAATHVFAAFQLAVTLGALASGLAILDRRLSPRLARLAVTAAAMLAAAAPFALWQVLRSPPSLNTLHTEPQGLMTLWGNVRVISPGVLWDWMGMAWLLFPLMLVPLWRAARTSVPALFLLTTTLAAALLMFAPPVVALLEPRLGYLLMRVVWMMPLAALAGWGLPWLVARWRAARGAARLAPGVMVAAALLSLAPAGADALRAPFAWSRMAAAERAQTPLPWRDDLAGAARTFGPDRVVLSDPVTSYCVPMLCPDYVVTMLDQHSPPGDPNAMRRLLDSRDALDPYADWTRLRDVVRRYGVDVIVLNDRFLEIPPADYWAPRPQWFEAERARLDAQPAAFEPVLRRDDFVVYRVHGSALDAPLAAVAPRPYVEPFRPTQHPIGHRMGPAMPDFLRLAMSRAVAHPGDTLLANNLWRGSGAHQGGSYQVVVRFDRPLPPGLDPPAFLGKPARKLLERSSGRLYRFRSDHLPVAGSYGVDLWEGDQVVRDSFQVVVPRNAAPGLWQVRVLMVRHPHYANLRLSDYFFDRDYFAGALAGELEILPPGSSRPAYDGREGTHVRH
jgi:hypothetical protein